MNKMRKLISGLLACLLLAGCGAAAEPAQTAAPTTAEVTEATVPVTTAAETEPEEETIRVLPDGVYTVDFVTDSSMFRANEACDGERVSVNGRQVKASYQVKTGDIIEIAFGQRTLKVEVTEINETANKASAPAMYKELE